MLSVTSVTTVFSYNVQNSSLSSKFGGIGSFTENIQNSNVFTRTYNPNNKTIKQAYGK
jgi:hypothetical protein